MREFLEILTLSLLSNGPLDEVSIRTSVADKARFVLEQGPGHFQSAVQQLLIAGLIEMSNSAGGKHYSLTDKGRAKLARILDYQKGIVSGIGSPWPNSQN